LPQISSHHAANIISLPHIIITYYWYDGTIKGVQKPPKPTPFPNPGSHSSSMFSWIWLSSKLRLPIFSLMVFSEFLVCFCSRPFPLTPKSFPNFWLIGDPEFQTSLFRITSLLDFQFDPWNLTMASFGLNSKYSENFNFWLFNLNILPINK